MDPRPATAVRVPLLSRLAETPLTFVLAALDVLVLAWVEAHGSSTDVATLVRFGALERGRVWAGEPWRLLTAAFLHVGWIHLGWNVLFGVPWCRPVERAIGPGRFLLVYLASAAGASALSLLGQDVVSAGASGALFGVVGATLALHRRGLGSWGAFFASRATRTVLLMVVAWSVVAGLALPIDQLAHGGGLAVGAAAAWLLSSPRPPRVTSWLASGATLAALVVAASWPRAGATRFEVAELEGELHEALRDGDTARAHRLAASAVAHGAASDALDTYRALLAVQEDGLEEALALARPLVHSHDPAVREEARKIVRGVAKTLGYRHYTGDGAAREPRLGLDYLEEACTAGDEESCGNARRIRGGD